jgi:hypothetical protein
MYAIEEKAADHWGTAEARTQWNPNPGVDPGRDFSSRERPRRCQQRVGGILAGEMSHPPR